MIDRVRSSSSTPAPQAVPAAAPKAQAEAGRMAQDARAITPTREQETKVSESYDYGPDSSKLKVWFHKKVLLPLEGLFTRLSPGTWLARKSEGGTKGIRRLREGEFAKELALPVTGVAKTAHGWQAETIANPDDPQGRFDVHRYMPSLVFHKKEDSFPVLPDQDGDGDTKTDLHSYKHGVIGGDQPMKGLVSASQKGEYTVLTYSLFYVDNKAATYHVKDSSTMSVYLKPGEDGQLEPAYLYTSWHYGANMTPWEDVKKDGNGHPLVKVERGSHALRPYSKWEPAFKGGVVVSGGDGSMKHGGDAMPNKMTWISPQPNMQGATSFRAGDPAQKTLMDAYFGIYQERTNPVHPATFGYGELPES